MVVYLPLPAGVQEGQPPQQLPKSQPKTEAPQPQAQTAASLLIIPEAVEQPLSKVAASPAESQGQSQQPYMDDQPSISSTKTDPDWKSQVSSN